MPTEKQSMTFFGKLDYIYGQLNLLSKLLQIFTVDEIGVTIVHRPGKVVVQINVYTITSAEKGKTHTIVS